MVVEGRSTDAGFPREFANTQFRITALENRSTERGENRIARFPHTSAQVSPGFAHLTVRLFGMKQNGDAAFAWTLIWATALMFVALLGHPAAGSGHGRSTQELLELVYAARFHLGTMHAAAIALQLVAATCVLAFCRKVGLAHPLVAFAAVALAAAAGGICVAGTIDGFLVPAFAAPHLALGDGAPLDMRGAIAAGAITIQYSTKFAIALMAASIFLLSLQLIATPVLRIVGAVGLLLSTVQGIALVAVAMLTPHNVALSVLPVLVWQVVLGVVWRANPGAQEVRRTST